MAATPRTLLKRFPPLPYPNNSMQGSSSYFFSCHSFFVCLVFFLGADVRMFFVYVVDVKSCDPSKINKQKKSEANTSECDCF